MHILDSYSIVSGSKIGRPWVNPQFFALPFEKYICLHNGSANPARIYDYWQDVIDYIKPYLDKQGVSLVQIGGPEDILINGVFDARGTTKRQMQFIVQNCQMWIGNDTSSMHFASALDKKIVGLHACLYPSNSGPVWSKEEDVILMEAPREGKPSFSMQEAPKTMNNIKPEDVANNIFKMLGATERIKEETVYIGDQYIGNEINIIPSTPFHPKYAGLNVNMRFDLSHDLFHLQSWARHCKVNIITKRHIPSEILIPFKKNVLAIQCNLSGNFTKSEISDMKKAGTVNLFWTLDEQGLAAKRLEFFEEHVHHQKTKFPKLDGDNLRFYTNRKIVDGEMEYLTDGRFSGRIGGSDKLLKQDLSDLKYLRIVKYD